uniref:Centrosomal protein 83 n=1 Tax=Periophthalmus magnuspinnatus TaxID=409849 RepID=A0A3B4AYA0_9GOBI
MTTTALGQSAPLPSNIEAGMGRSAAMLGLSASLGGAEMELQKMLIDERMKSENHRTNYQTLKAEHTLQDEFTRVQNELRRLLNDRQTQQERQQLLLAELRGELLDKTRELEDLKLQVMTPQRLELLRAQVQQEMEGPIRERFNKLEEEAERYRSEYNKLRYDFTLIKSQFDHQREEHFRTLEERRIIYEAEQISRLERDREDLVARYQGMDPLCDGKRVETLLREKAQLLTRLKGLETEVRELRAQRENSGQQAENVQRIQVRQISEAQAAIKSLEAERQSLRLQLDRIETELKSTLEQNSELTAKLHKAEREVNSLNCQIDSMKHSHKLELATVKLECARSKVEVEREREALQAQIDLQSDVEVLKAAVERHKEILVEKEREAVRRVQAAREEEFRKTAVLHEDLELENRLVTLEQQRALQDTASQAQKEEWEERIRSAQQAEESVRRELQNLSKLHQQSSQLDELERQKAEVTELKRQNQELSVQLGTLSQSESDLTETNQRLRETLDKAREELRAFRTEAERSQHRTLEERRVEWLEEKHKLQEREAELQQKYSQLKDKLQRAANAQKKRKMLTENRERKLQDRIQLLEAKITEVELEAEAAKQATNSEERARLSRQLKELQRRHNEFRQLLL